MNGARPLAVLITTLAVGPMFGCGPKRVRTTASPRQDVIVLLPDPGDGSVGRAMVSNAAGTVNLAGARASTSVRPNQPPAAVSVMSEAEVRRLFGETLAALPPPPEHFVLHFRFESEELTDESRALLPRILQLVRARPFPDVAVVGHTDTSGSRASNLELGLRRANSIRTRLVEAGVRDTVIEVTSHGEADPLVKTADEVLEPRNRRVEITIR
jgi:outer membrane protein OmpA-like peptidoglycan-associated protein